MKKRKKVIVEKKELYYCYFKNGDGKWHLYYPEGVDCFDHVQNYTGGAIKLWSATEAVIVSMSKPAPLTLSKVPQRGIIVHKRATASAW